MVLLLSELLKDWSGTYRAEEIKVEVKGITECSLNVKDGFLFVARLGKNDDGMSYISEAIEGGAIAIVIDRALPKDLVLQVPLITVTDCSLFLSYACALLAGNPSERLKVIAVTGTNGKTTVTHFIDQLLRKFGEKTAVIGTTGVFIDGNKFEYDAPDMTTLPAEYLHPLLKKCEDLGVDNILLEASSLGLSAGRLADCEIDIGIVLNIGLDHHDEHGGKQNYIDAKKILIKKSKQVIVNRDDAQCVSMSDVSTSPCVYFGMYHSLDYFIPEKLGLSVPGKFNRMNVIAAVSALLLLGYQFEEILSLVPELKLPKGRLQRLEKDGVVVYIDFAHTPDALDSVLEALSLICEGRLITVFGCGGNRDKGKRSEMGELAVFYSSSVIVTSDNPRKEDPLAIIKDILEGFGEDCQAIEVEPDRKKAIQKAISLAVEGDIVLIAGKGHEEIQHTAEGVFPFSDWEEARSALLANQVSAKQNK
ncbi:UDP-N-acetylmuramoyl-L-alanyl-D-glutamate--2,6-diaminopimelate ligase [Sporosarcina sp. CAU 1771]